VLILLQDELSSERAQKHKVDLSDFWDALEKSCLQKAYEEAIELSLTEKS